MWYHGKYRGFGVRRSQIQILALPLCGLELHTASWSLGFRICKVGILTDSSHGSEESAAVRCLACSGWSWSRFTVIGSAFTESELVRVGKDQRERRVQA